MHWWSAVLLRVSAAATVAGNALVLVAFAARPALRGVRSNLYIFSLALTDLLVGLVAMPLNVDYHMSGSLWTHHDHVCVFWLLTDTVICTASIWTMVAIAVDRLMAVAWPISYMNLGRCSALVVLIGVWLLSLGICLPPFMLQKLHYQLCTFINDLWYDVYAPLGAFFFPLLLIVACYSFIFFHLWCKMRHKAAREQRRSEIERRMTLVSTSAGATHNHNRNRGSLVRGSLTPSLQFTTATTNVQASSESAATPSPKISLDATATTTTPLMMTRKTSMETTRTTIGFSSSPPSVASSPKVSSTSNARSQLMSPQPPQLTSSSSSSPRATARVASPRILIDGGDSTDDDKGAAAAAGRNDSGGSGAFSFSGGQDHHRRSGVGLEAILETEDQVLLQMVVLVAAFVACWLPFWVFYVTLSFCLRRQTCVYRPYVQTLGAAFQWLGYANSLINPIMYTIFNSEFRAAFRALVNRCRQRGWN